ncbi:histidine phosphatase family protein [Ammoniphilus oxalaticus]|uniref:histidine phosphatase family protein n=1 Tax=Ammoniphilus oxalaticus TaxID=66863 RepID=UPI0014727584|nr:histidine phosphatase family protein [Ammoniphilus oxalaticus]
MTHFYLIRHGETDWNHLKKLQGHTDIPLNESGIKQAKRIAKRLATTPIDHFYSSDLKRAKRTAQEIVRYHDLKPVLQAEEFRERCYGEWEGLHWDQIPKLYPGYGGGRPLGGEFGIETYEAMQQRGMSKLTELIGAHPNQHIAIISHGGFINSILHLISDGEVGTGKTKILNTSLNHISYEAGKWDIHTINDCAHLEFGEKKNDGL